jgi:hypothetical protein
MSLNEVLKEARGLSREEQLKLIQTLAEELAKTSEGFVPGQEYQLWSPYDSFEAAHALEKFLQDEKQNP